MLMKKLLPFRLAPFCVLLARRESNPLSMQVGVKTDKGIYPLLAILPFCKNPVMHHCGTGKLVLIINSCQTLILISINTNTYYSLIHGKAMNTIYHYLVLWNGKDSNLQPLANHSKYSFQCELPPQFVPYMPHGIQGNSY